MSPARQRWKYEGRGRVHGLWPHGGPDAQSSAGSWDRGACKWASSAYSFGCFEFGEESPVSKSVEKVETI